MADEKPKAAVPAVAAEEERQMADGFIRGLRATGRAWEMRLQRRIAELERQRTVTGRRGG